MKAIFFHTLEYTNKFGITIPIESLSMSILTIKPKIDMDTIDFLKFCSTRYEDINSILFKNLKNKNINTSIIFQEYEPQILGELRNLSRKELNEVLSSFLIEINTYTNILENTKNSLQKEREFLSKQEFEEVLLNEMTLNLF